ncbi:MAG: acyl-CoA thioester hydrolase [Paraglaciecola sp.]|jgi:acyl-CoA thioester hydrolase
MDKPFQYLLRVRYSECDAQLVVFNARYGDYVDVAGTEYFRVLFGGYQMLLEQGLDNQVVKLNTSWKAAARFDDVLVISVETSHIGTTSFSLRLSFSRYNTNEELAVSEITYVMVDTHTYQKTPIPEKLRIKLHHGAMNVITDHAGVQHAK